MKIILVCCVRSRYLNHVLSPSSLHLMGSFHFPGSFSSDICRPTLNSSHNSVSDVFFIILFPSVISCSLGEFQCAEGHCIPWSSFCDGIANCEDSKDEPEGCLSKPYKFSATFE